MKRTGVFVCHCGINIAGTVDVKKVTQELSKHPGVVHSEDYVYMCSDPGQNLIMESIKENKLDKVVVACCSPTLHESTFRKAAKEAGINEFQCEIANIREQCSWVHKDKDEATKKAIKLTQATVEKVRQDESLEPIGVSVT
ncbi:MAG TPA: disulfide reductase, partial [Acidobacteriota bacterium]|nr:disulfide reductase [Acidobacteriota bacterium]